MRLPPGNPTLLPKLILDTNIKGRCSPPKNTHNCLKHHPPPIHSFLSRPDLPILSFSSLLYIPSDRTFSFVPFHKLDFYPTNSTNTRPTFIYAGSYFPSTKTMQLFNILLSLVITSSLITASPVDRSLLAKRQDYEDVIVVTVTSAYTITISSTVPQVTKTVTFHANFGNNPYPFVGVSTTTTEEVITPAVIAALTTAAAPVADNTPAAVVAPDTTTSSPAAAPSPAVDNAVSSNSASTVYTGQGTYYSTG
jgi:hypothetical protein